MITSYKFPFFFFVSEYIFLSIKNTPDDIGTRELSLYVAQTILQGTFWTKSLTQLNLIASLKLQHLSSKNLRKFIRYSMFSHFTHTGTHDSYSSSASVGKFFPLNHFTLFPTMRPFDLIGNCMTANDCGALLLAGAEPQDLRQDQTRLAQPSLVDGLAPSHLLSTSLTSLQLQLSAVKRVDEQ